MPVSQNESVRIRSVQRMLKRRYPNVTTQLHHRNAFELLTATILSAQCTDRQVNAVTRTLFERFPTPAALAAAPLAEVEALIRPTGYFRNKARHIKGAAQALVERYNSAVPADIVALTSLPGVGRKTANVVRDVCFAIPCIVVDTHVARLSKRLGLTMHTHPDKIERDLMAILPEKNWRPFCLELIYHGRAVCKARQPKCTDCPLQTVCPFPEKTSG